MLQIPIHRKQTTYKNVPLFAGFTRQMVVSRYLLSTVSFIWHQKKHAGISLGAKSIAMFPSPFFGGVSRAVSGHHCFVYRSLLCSPLCLALHEIAHHHLEFHGGNVSKNLAFSKSSNGHNRPNILKKTTQKKCRIVRVKMK